MASNKNQHYVPRCYLRPFSLNEDGLAISLYNIDRQKFIPLVPVRSQCSGDYFYGRDPLLEKAIQAVETAYATRIGNILKPGYRLLETDRIVLRKFWLFQYMRTEAAARRSAEMSASMQSAAGITDKNYSMEIKDAVQVIMHTFVDQFDVVDDLKVCLVRNHTDVPFVTSDDPAILTNRWHLDHSRRMHYSFGLGNAGLLFLLPMSPTVLCIGYDGDIYSVPHQDGWIRANHQADVEAFNEHQFLNCRANIFVGREEHKDYVHAAYQRSAGSRLASRHILNYAVLDRDEEGVEHYRVVESPDSEKHEKALLHLQDKHPVPSKWPSQIAWRPNGCAYSNDTAVRFVRKSQVHRRAGPPFRKVKARA